MIALLLAAAAHAGPFPATPQVVVTLPQAAPLTVTGPENSERNAEYPWTHEQTLLSPRQDAAAVRFCWEIGKYDGCQVFLARPGQPTLRLKNSDVRRLLWTADGKYLVGAGRNTVRLWNLVGVVRTAVPAPGEVYAQPARPSSQIMGLILSGRDLCVRTEDTWYSTNGQRVGRSLSVTRYALPLLKPLEVLSFGLSDGPDVPCHLPHTEP